VLVAKDNSVIAIAGRMAGCYADIGVVWCWPGERRPRCSAVVLGKLDMILFRNTSTLPGREEKHF
jgi:hypothetical protein